MAHTREWKVGDKTMVFLPFPRANCREGLDSTLGRKEQTIFGEIEVEAGWNSYKTDVFGRILGVKFRDDDVFCADDASRVAKLQELKNERDMLYTRGHCSAGSDTLQSPDRNVKVNAEQILALFKGALSTDFKGIIKVYSCHSGSDWRILWWSFAQRLADVMYDDGYKKCKYYGYVAKLSTWSETKTLVGKTRKAAVGDTKQGDAYPFLGFASTRRIEIVPTNRFD